MEKPKLLWMFRSEDKRMFKPHTFWNNGQYFADKKCIAVFKIKQKHDKTRLR